MPIVRASGPDVSRTARGRLAVESVLTPGALLGDEVAWHDEDDDRAGALFEEERTFDGITIPSRGRVGWWFGTERWPEGEFFRFEIDDASFEAGPAPA